jgi:hypothetical protein
MGFIDVFLNHVPCFQISSDRRFDMVSEQQRRDIFRRYVAGIEETESADASIIPAALGGIPHHPS